MTGNETEDSLADLRVLDMAQGGYAICGKILADLGADVIKIEPPGGETSGRIGPYYKDIPDPQKSLFCFAYNTSKRGITLDIETSDGQQIFRRLAKTADVVVESFSPGYLDNLGLGYQSLSQLNSGLIFTSITPYGQTGPKAHYQGSDLVTWASSDGLITTGDPDRPPVWISFPQPSLHAGAEACVGTLVAYWYRLNTGEGQHVDVSAQDTFFWSVEQARLQMYEMMGFCYERSGSEGHLATGVRRSQHYPCKDGFIAFMAAGGGLRKQRESTASMVKWMAEEGMASDWLINYNWETDYDTSRLTQEESDRIDQEFKAFFITKTKDELFEQALQRDIVIAPVYTAEDICHLEHLKARDFWVKVEHDELKSELVYCGALKNIFTETPGVIKRRAPLIGEHNLDIYEKELGFSREELVALKSSGVI